MNHTDDEDVIPQLGASASLSAMESVASFEEASYAVLNLLVQRFPMGSWVVTRVLGEDWVILAVVDSVYGMEPGMTFPWGDTYCSRMVVDQGIRIANNARNIEKFRRAAINLQATIGSYVGVPLLLGDGTLFGTLCAVDPSEKSFAAEEVLAELESFSQLLSTVALKNLQSFDQSLAKILIDSRQTLDPLTGLLDRAAWERVLHIEEERCRTLGTSVVIAIIDIDQLKLLNFELGEAAGDVLLRRTAQVLSDLMGSTDVVARIGGDEFAVAVRDTTASDLERVKQRIATALRFAGINIAIGVGVRRHGGTVFQAVEDALSDVDVEVPVPHPQGL